LYQCNKQSCAFFVFALSLSCIFAAGCHPREAEQQVQKPAAQKSAQQTKSEILDAIAANDVSKIRLLLPSEGPADFDVGAYKEFLDSASNKFANTDQLNARIDEIPVIRLLSSRVRHLLGKPMDITGKMKAELTMAGYGNFIADIGMKSKEGAHYRLYISTKETEFVNTNISDEKFLVDEDAIYRIQGYVVGKNLEVERVELVSGGNSGHGMVIPINSFLPSTADFLSIRWKQHHSKGKQSSKP
jgi:hypothetical protein